MRSLFLPCGVVKAVTVGLFVAGLAGGALAEDSRLPQRGELQRLDKSESALAAQSASTGGGCSKLPAVCQPTCMKCKCDTVANPVLCLTVCNAPKDCRAALAAQSK